jgi:predicted DNA-binding ribbon-helix-helix protein
VDWFVHDGQKRPVEFASIFVGVLHCCNKTISERVASPTASRLIAEMYSGGVPPKGWGSWAEAFKSKFSHGCGPSWHAGATFRAYLNSTFGLGSGWRASSIFAGAKGILWAAVHAAPQRRVITKTSVNSPESRLMEGGMNSRVVKRSIIIAGHKTSVSLEDAFWRGLKEIASGRGVILSEMVAAIDSGRNHGNLSSALRLFVLDHYRNLIGTAADTRASHLETTAREPPASLNKS